jgi:hypothetical protein
LRNFHEGIRLINITKKLFFAAALLVPCLAYGASANLSIEVVPPGSATAPPQAAAVGFTTLALGNDFTQPQPSNWLNCDRSDTPAMWYANTEEYQGPIHPCSDETLRPDPTYGFQVLDLRFLPSELGTYRNQSMLMTRSYSGNLQQNFPYGYYEATWRIGQEPPGFSHDFFSLVAQPGMLEVDFPGFGNSGGGSNYACNMAWGDWSQSPPPFSFINCPQVDVFNYHTYGTLFTGDGTTIGFCEYFDNTKVGCGSYTPNGGQATERRFLLLWLSAWCGQNDTDASCIPTSGWTSADIYWKNVHVWSCANWASSMCNTAAVTQ